MRAIVPVAILVVLASGFAPAVIAPGGGPSGSIVVRVEISNTAVDATGFGSDSWNDWVINGRLFSNSLCSTEAGTTHNRSYAPRFIDFTLRFNGTSDYNACLTATYQINLTAYKHDFDNLIDLQGTAAGLCPGNAVNPSRADAANCTGVISGFELEGTNSVLSGDLDGRDDNNGNETNMWLDYDVRVVSSTVSDIDDPGWTVWTVRLVINNFTSIDDPDPDWLIDANVSKSDGSCAGESRTPHSRFFENKVLDILIRTSSTCDNEQVQVRLSAYKHYSDAYLDLSTAGTQSCGLGPGNRVNLPSC